MNRAWVLVLAFAAAACVWSQSPPPTKLEGFEPTEGSVIVVGTEQVGGVAGISVEAHQVGDSRGLSARGLVVDVTDAQKHAGRSFIDLDEVPELLKGFDAILQVASNPTQLKNFEVRCKTRGEFEISAFSNAGAALSYSVRGGRATRSTVVINSAQMERLRGLVDTASQKLAGSGK